MDFDMGIGIDVNVVVDVDDIVDVVALAGFNICISMLITELERSLSDIQLPYLLEDA